MVNIAVDEVKSILITRTDRLGDVILTLPLVNVAAGIFRNASIYFLVKDYVLPLVENYHTISEVVTEEKISAFVEKFRYFKSKKIDLAISVKPRFDLALLFFLLRIKYRIGTAYRWYSFLYNFKVYEHRKDSVKHESEYNMNLLKFFLKDVPYDYSFYFKYSDNEKNKLNQKISGKLNLSDNFIIIHPGSGNSAKDLPADKFSEYINLFAEHYPEFKIVLTGLESEQHLIKTITGKLNNTAALKVIDLSGFLNLRELLILIDNCKLFISNSTGPIHIAGALNKNIIGFYPNEIPMNETRWKPLSSNTVILKPIGNSEMGSIDMQNVIEQTHKFFN